MIHFILTDNTDIEWWDSSIWPSYCFLVLYPEIEGANDLPRVERKIVEELRKDVKRLEELPEPIFMTIVSTSRIVFYEIRCMIKEGLIDPNQFQMSYIDKDNQVWEIVLDRWGKINIDRCKVPNSIWGVFDTQLDRLL